MFTSHTWIPLPEHNTHMEADLNLVYSILISLESIGHQLIMLSTWSKCIIRVENLNREEQTFESKEDIQCVGKNFGSHNLDFWGYPIGYAT